MSWLKHHRKAELLSDMAARVVHLPDPESAEEAKILYFQAGEAEHEAVEDIQLDTHLKRTRGILAVSSVALMLKANSWYAAARRSVDYLEELELPSFAIVQINAMLKEAEEKGKVRIPRRSDP